MTRVVQQVPETENLSRLKTLWEIIKQAEEMKDNPPV